jgi:hypothetical protein
VRYQPSSLPDAHLSRVVLAEFIQLTPNRTATVTISGQRVSVILVGRSHTGTTVAEGPGLFRVQLEQRNPAIATGW